MKRPSKPFFFGLANTLLHLSSVLWVPLARQLRKDPSGRRPGLSCFLCPDSGGSDAPERSQRKKVIREATVLQPLDEKSCSSSGK